MKFDEFALMVVLYLAFVAIMYGNFDIVFFCFWVMSLLHRGGYDSR